MKVHDLAFGSLVLHGDKIYEVETIYGLSEEVCFIDYVPIHEISGVQLTNDIFKKLGFVWQKDAWVRGYLIITTYSFNNHVFDCKGFAIQYVHQLQVLANLLRAELNTKSIL